MSFKLDLVLQSLQPGASVARLAREHGINDNLLFTWVSAPLRTSGYFCPACGP
ncbi:hypothetical protein CKG00_12865 [Morganella morganii]|uniref:Transposase n=1 Tax=Morganella morganii TaxID=582 RepID=A0A433ZYF6_MORMO|nr:hypothetical protein CKG00_12865 [Morganella morganii]